MDAAFFRMGAGQIEWRLVPFFLKKKGRKRYLPKLLKPEKVPFYHRLDSNEWQQASGDDITITGCCVASRKEKITGVYAVVGGKRYDALWGLPRKSISPSLCGDGGDGPYGYGFTIPLPGKNCRISMHAVLDSGQEYKFLNRWIKIRKYGLVRRTVDGWRRIWLRFWLRRKIARIQRGEKGGDLGSVLLTSPVMNRTGAPILLMHLARGLKAKGYKVLCASFAEHNSLGEDLKESGIPLMAVPEMRYPEFRLFEEFRDFDVVIANTVASVGAVEGFSKAGFPVIWWIQDGYSGLQALKGQNFSLHAYLSAHTVVFPSPTTREIYKETGERNVEIIPNGIPDPSCPPKQPGTDAGRRITFTLLGTVCERKGQDVLIGAVKRLPAETVARACFQMVGDRSDESFYHYCVSLAGGLEPLNWVSECPPEMALQVIRDSDVLIVASRDEALPVVIQEAMALGKAVISSRAGGVADFLKDGHDCLLFPVNDDGALAEAITRCILEPELIGRLGLKARKTYEKQHQMNGMADRFAVLMEEAKKSRRSF